MDEQSDLTKLQNSIASLQTEIQRLASPYEDALSHRVFDNAKKRLVLYFGAWATIITAVLAFFGFNAYDKIVSGATQLAIQNFSNNVQPELVKKVEESIQKDREKLVESIKEKYETIDKELTGSSEGRATLSDRLGETVKQLQNLESKVNTLAESVNPVLEKQNIPPPVPTTTNTELAKALDRIALSKYTVYIQYKQEDESLIVLLRDFLKGKGYVVPGMEKVKYDVREIRYFHDDDQPIANNLLGDVNEFIRTTFKGSDIKIDVKDLSRRYPNAPKRVIELWLSL